MPTPFVIQAGLLFKPRLSAPESCSGFSSNLRSQDFPSAGASTFVAGGSFRGGSLRGASNGVPRPLKPPLPPLSSLPRDRGRSFRLERDRRPRDRERRRREGDRLRDLDRLPPRRDRERLLDLERLPPLERERRFERERRRERDLDFLFDLDRFLLLDRDFFLLFDRERFLLFDRERERDRDFARFSALLLASSTVAPLLLSFFSPFSAVESAFLAGASGVGDAV